jgi:hypothetical protein
VTASVLRIGGRAHPAAACRAEAYCVAMRLQPNPPRLITVGIAIVLGAIGLVYAWPISSLVPILDPLTSVLGSIGLTMDRELAYLCLFACPSLLVIGSLLPGI